jgi:hypothetical protein
MLRAGKVVRMAEYRARGAGNGVDVDERIAQLFRLREGNVTYTRIYTDREEALRAVGFPGTDLSLLG